MVSPKSSGTPIQMISSVLLDGGGFERSTVDFRR